MLCPCASSSSSTTTTRASVCSRSRCAPPGPTLDIRRADADDLVLDGHDAVMALPGLADPPDDTRAVRATRAVLAQALATGLPVLGICLGAELLVEAAGGSTRPCAAE